MDRFTGSHQMDVHVTEEGSVGREGDIMSSDTADQGVAGVGMLLANYTSKDGAASTYESLKRAMDAGQFYYEDAAVVSRDVDGTVSITEHGDMSTGKGAGIGALIGGVIGILGGPAGIAIGAGAGAAIGGVAAHSDAGFNNETLERIGGALPNNTSALAVTTSKDFVEAARSQSTDDETVMMAQDIADVITSNLNAGQDVLLALVLTENGVAATRVAASDDAVGVFGMVATDEGAAARAVVATDEGVAAAEAAATAAADDSTSPPAADDSASASTADDSTSPPAADDSASSGDSESRDGQA